MSDGKLSKDDLLKLKKELKQELKPELLNQIRRELNLEVENDDGNLTRDERVSAWLNRQGYPLEMEVASIASACGFDVSQSEYYVDPETDEVREIDLVLSKQGLAKDDMTFWLSYKLFIECKSSTKDRPWLIFSTPSTEPTKDLFESMFTAGYSIISNAYGSHLVFDRVFSGKEDLYIFPELSSEPWIGHGVTQAFVDGADVPFKALMSATKAACANLKM